MRRIYIREVNPINGTRSYPNKYLRYNNNYLQYIVRSVQARRSTLVDSDIDRQYSHLLKKWKKRRILHSSRSSVVLEEVQIARYWNMRSMSMSMKFYKIHNNGRISTRVIIIIVRSYLIVPWIVN